MPQPFLSNVNANAGLVLQRALRCPVVGVAGKDIFDAVVGLSRIQVFGKRNQTFGLELRPVAFADHAVVREFKVGYVTWLVARAFLLICHAYVFLLTVLIIYCKRGIAKNAPVTRGHDESAA